MPSWFLGYISWGFRDIQTVLQISKHPSLCTIKDFCPATAYKSILFPFYRLVLIRVRIRKALHLTGFAAKETVEVGADLVALAFAQGVTLCASRLYAR